MSVMQNEKKYETQQEYEWKSLDLRTIDWIELFVLFLVFCCQYQWLVNKYLKMPLMNVTINALKYGQVKHNLTLNGLTHVDEHTYTRTHPNTHLLCCTLGLKCKST